MRYFDSLGHDNTYLDPHSAIHLYRYWNSYSHYNADPTSWLPLL